MPKYGRGVAETPMLQSTAVASQRPGLATVVRQIRNTCLSLKVHGGSDIIRNNCVKDSQHALHGKGLGTKKSSLNLQAVNLNYPEASILSDRPFYASLHGRQRRPHPSSDASSHWTS